MPARTSGGSGWGRWAQPTSWTRKTSLSLRGPARSRLGAPAGMGRSVPQTDLYSPRHHPARCHRQSARPFRARPSRLRGSRTAQGWSAQEPGGTLCPRQRAAAPAGAPRPSSSAHPAVALSAAVAGAAAPSGDSGPMLDGRALRAYRNRLQGLEEKLFGRQPTFARFTSSRSALS